MVYTDIGRFGKNMLEELFPEGLKNVNHDVFILSMWGFPVLGGVMECFQSHSKGLSKHPNDSRNHLE